MLKYFVNVEISDAFCCCFSLPLFYGKLSKNMICIDADNDFLLKWSKWLPDHSLK